MLITSKNGYPGYLNIKSMADNLIKEFDYVIAGVDKLGTDVDGGRNIYGFVFGLKGNFIEKLILTFSQL